MDSSNQGRCLDPSQLEDILFEISVKRAHAPGGNKTFETSKKRLKSSRGKFAYDSIIVSSAWELTSVSMHYSQGDGVNTSLSRTMYCTVFGSVPSLMLV